MRFQPHYAQILVKESQAILANDEPEETKIHRLWATIAFTQAVLLARRLNHYIGNTVMTGPFQGLRLTPAVLTGLFGPYLTGNYEHELHPFLEEAVAAPYQTILNIGCAFGYYACGLAMRMPQVKVFAFDINPLEQERCEEMALLNNVADRVQVGGLFRGENFADFQNQKTLVVMDIEGAEKTLLNPTLFPALQQMDIIVELHDVLDTSLSQTLMQRCAATHDIQFIPNRSALFDYAPYIGTQYVDPFESLILNWENRDGPTPWAIMRANH